MIEPEEHASADGLLTLAVESLKDGDVAIGFRGYPWHTHADILASINSTSETDAVRQFIDDVLNERLLYKSLTMPFTTCGSRTIQ